MEEGTDPLGAMIFQIDASSSRFGIKCNRSKGTKMQTDSILVGTMEDENHKINRKG